MNHIFYLHSNTCVISAYDVIVDLLNKKESIIIVSERYTKFPFLEGKVQLYDMQKIIDAYRKNTNNSIMKLLNYKFTLIPHCEVYAEEIIEGEDFIFYTPSYNMYTVKPFLNNDHCQGYYFLEEGYMAYLNIDTLRSHYNNRRYKKGRILLDLIGSGDVFDYNVTAKFKGCFGLSEFSFPWCVENKVITGFDDYFSNLPKEEVDIDYILSTDFLTDDIDILRAAFKKTYDKITSFDEDARIAIKFHPSALIYEKEKTENIVNYVKEFSGGNNIKILPSSFSIESYMYHHKIDLYCIFSLSSLQLYALMLKSRAFRVTKTVDNTITEIVSIPEFLKISTREWKQ